MDAKTNTVVGAAQADTNIVRRRVGIKTLTLRSEIMFQNLRDQSSQKLNNAMYRLGELYKMAERYYTSDILKQIDDWFKSNIIAELSRYRDELSQFAEALSSEADTDIDECEIPQMDVRFEVIHKSFSEMLTEIKRIDITLEEIEMSLLCGAGDFDTNKLVIRQVKHQIEIISAKIFRVTSPGKRNGAAFNTRYFLDQLRDGVFTMESAMAGVTSDNSADEIESGVQENTDATDVVVDPVLNSAPTKKTRASKKEKEEAA
jgi:hypothetical protein